MHVLTYADVCRCARPRAERALAGHDAYALFAALGGGGGAAGCTPQAPHVPGREGGLLFTGPTGTNVCDVTIVLIGAPGEAL